KDTGGGGALEHAIARLAHRAARPVGATPLRRLRQRDQHGGLAKRQAARFLAEIGERGRANALEIAAIGCKAQIKREYLVLGQGALDLEPVGFAAALPGGCAPHAARASARPAWGESMRRRRCVRG